MFRFQHKRATHTNKQTVTLIANAKFDPLDTFMVKRDPKY